MMTDDILCRIRTSLQVVGLVLVAVFYSAQGLAYIDFDGPELRETLTIKKDSPETIDYSFTLSTRGILGDAYALSFSDNELRTFVDAVPDTLPITALNGLLTSNKISFNDNTNGNGEFILGEWSDLRRQIPTSITFTIPFSRPALENWLDQLELNNEPSEISFYAVGHGYTIDFDDLPDQSLGVPDSKRVTIEIKRENYAHISGLENIILPQLTAEGFCVSSTTGTALTGGKITLDVESKNGFQLLPEASGNRAATSHTIDYSITLRGKNNNAFQQVTLTQSGPSNKQWDAHHAGFLDEDCVRADNMALAVTMDDGDEVSVPIGKYTDEVTITVAPAS